jgi:ADP-heptose:LPS heptosyltransferase/glycosyltransferase involved in cell wall biosynthesis
MEQRKIVFSHRRALGDGLMFTAGVRDFKLLFPEILINVDSNQSALWENNPYIDRSIKKDDPDVEYYKVGYPMIGTCNNINMHFSSMFLFDMIAVADLHKELPITLGEFCAAFSNGDVGDPSLGNSKKNDKAKEPFITLRDKYRGFGQNFSRQRGDLHLSEEEKKYNMIKEIYDINNYWVIAPGGKRDCTAKIWDWKKFQEVIDYFQGQITFVTIGKSDLLNVKLNGVINLIDKFNSDVRGLIPLVYHSNGCVTGPSFLNHLAAAIPPRRGSERKPCVAIFGGREPSSWSWYCNHQMLHTNGIFDCCNNGGCWKARTYPMPKDPKHNENLCRNTVKVDGRTVQKCMDVITAQDVIRSIEKYYEGDLYRYDKPKKRVEVKKTSKIVTTRSSEKEINLLGNLNSKGGGEQSLCMIAKMFERRGYKVNLYPWGSVHQNYKNLGLNIKPVSYKSGMLEEMKSGIPLLFYANDCIWDFVKTGEDIVNKSSDVVVGINFCNGTLPKAKWLAKTKKLRAVIFQNQEKMNEFKRDAIGFDDTRLISMYGAIDLQKFLELCPPKREKDDNKLVVLKHCVADYRKYVTRESDGQGDKIHIWQKHLWKEKDIKFYKRLLKDTKNVYFEFMQAPTELEQYFQNEKRMKFRPWDSIPVSEFLQRGHVYLYRTSNLWRDQYPRTVAEALATGLPILTEPRDGTKDRVQYGDTGFYCVDYDGFLYALKLLQRKEDYRHHLGRNAKDWARENLDPERWVDVIEESL